MAFPPSLPWYPAGHKGPSHPLYPYPAVCQHCTSGDSLQKAQLLFLHDPCIVLEKQEPDYWLFCASCPGERALGQGHGFHAWPTYRGVTQTRNAKAPDQIPNLQSKEAISHVKFLGRGSFCPCCFYRQICSHHGSLWKILKTVFKKRQKKRWKHHIM